MGGRYPVDGTLYRTVFGGRVVGALEFHHFPVLILDNLVALDDVSVFEAHLAVGFEAEELLGGILHEIRPFDEEVSGEGDAALGALRIGRIQRAVEPFHLAFGPVGDGELDGVLHHHVAVGALIEVLTDTPLQELDIHELVPLGNANLVTEHLEGIGGIAATAHTAEGGHAGVVPAAHKALLHQFQQLALAHERIGEVQAGELVLMGRIDAEGLDEPVIQGPVHVKLQCANGMRDMLDGIALAVGVIIHGVDAPLVSGTVMVGELDAVQQRVPEHHVGMGHVYLGPEHLLPFRVLAGFHFPEQLEVLLRGAVPPGAGGAGLVHGAAVLPDLLLGLVVHIGQAAFDEVFGPFVELVEIVRCIQLLVPLEAQPLDVFLDGVHVFGVFLGGIGVIVTQIGFSAVLLRQAKVEADALGMAQMQIAVGFRRETGHDGVHFAFGQILFNDFFQKIEFALFHIFSAIILQRYAFFCNFL